MKSMVNIIENGSLVTFFSIIFLCIGYISNLAYNRVIGIPMLSDGFNTYIEAGGAFIIQLSQSLYKFPFNIEFLHINSFNYIVIISLVVMSVFFKFSNNLLSKKYKEKVLSICLFIILLVLIFSTVKLYIPFYEVSSVIQPSSIEENELVNKPRIHKFPFDNKRIKKYYENKFNSCKKSHEVKCLFDLRNNLGVSARKETFITLVQISLVPLVVLYLLAYWFGSLKYGLFKYVFIFYLSIQTLSIPYIHGVIGSNYTFPIANIKLEKNTVYKGVYILKSSKNYLFFLDRRNYMSIFQIEKNKIYTIEQLAKLSLFINCSQDFSEVRLCEEIYWQ